MREFFRKNHRFLFYSSWIILGLIQSRFTELLDDEAYYWVYSKFLDWGYFDHPPMVALLIKLGYSIFQNELGVRLLFRHHSLRRDSRSRDVSSAVAPGL